MKGVTQNKSVHRADVPCNVMLTVSYVNIGLLNYNVAVGSCVKGL